MEPTQFILLLSVFLAGVAACGATLTVVCAVVLSGRISQQETANA